MNKFRKLLIVSVAGASLGLGVASAQAEHGRCPHGEFDKTKFMEKVQKQQAELHDKLHLRAEQESAWQAFTASVPPIPGERPDFEALSKLPAPERMDHILKHMQQRQERVAQRAAAVKALYAVLTPEQQKIFDENFMRRPHHRKSGEKA